VVGKSGPDRARVPFNEWMLIDRDQDLAAMIALAGEAQGGQGRLVFLGGEAGVGKTALVTALRAAIAPGLRVRRGAVDHFPTAAALGALVDAFPELGDAVIGATPIDRTDLFRRVRSTLAAEPTLLIVEDVQWADEATHDLLRFLGRRLDGLPALIVATYRDEEVLALHPLSVVLGDLAGAPGVVRRSVDPLTVAGVGELIGTGGSRVDARDLYQRTGGNPFFITEILAAATDEVPATIRDAVLARAGRLSPSARLGLGAAAVLERGADVRLIAAIADQPVQAVDECVAGGMLLEDGPRLVFRHELARLAIEQSLGPGARHNLHARALAELLTQPGSDDRAIARHAAACGDHVRVLEYAPRAAQTAARLGAHREAAAHYRVALQVADAAPGARAALFEALSYECYLTDELPEALAARRRSLELFELSGDLAAVGAAERWLSRLSWFLANTSDSERYARRAIRTLEPLGDSHELAMAYSNRAQLCMLSDDEAGTEHWGAQALELAARLNDREVELHALNNTGTARYFGGDHVEGRRRLRRSLELALEANAHEHVARAYTNLGSAAITQRTLAVGDRDLRAGIAYCDEYDLDSWSHYMSAWLAYSLAEQGRYDEALDWAERVLAYPRLSTVSRIPASVTVAQISGRRGSIDRDRLDELRTLAIATGEPQRLVPTAAARAEAAWLADDLDRISTEVDLAWDSVIAHPDPWLLGELVWWLSVAGIGRPTPIPLARPFALMVSGAWPAAAAAWDELGCPLWAALSLAHSPDIDDGRRAIEIVDALGLPAVRTAVLRRRHQLGLRVPRSPRPSSRTNASGLTAREVEVLALVADGRSNIEVGRALFISEKTVGHHMSSVLRKLGEPTRARAVATALRLGIVAPR
jgi:DNA-binding CsgD family transcriptional regulator/tetratricopeptide (TPR) repeat protein